MSIKHYNRYKEQYEKTKPIRGRKDDIRPLGDRRRDWEQVVRRETETGIMYGCHLYQTDCVMFAENGDVHLNIGSWESVSSAQFIAMHSPWGVSCYKRYSKIWVEMKDGKVYPIQANQTFIVKYDEATDSYYTNESNTVTQKVKDRSKSKEFRNAVSEFRDYARNMIKLADGWLRDEVIIKYKKYNDNGWRNEYFDLGTKPINRYDMGYQMSETTAKLVYGYITNRPDEDADEKIDRFLNALCMICSGTQCSERQNIRTEERIRKYSDGTENKYNEDIYEERYDYKSVVRRIDYIIEKANKDAITTSREIVVGDKPRSNVA
jgi:hypothetical protein